MEKKKMKWLQITKSKEGKKLKCEHYVNYETSTGMQTANTKCIKNRRPVCLFDLVGLGWVRLHACNHPK